MLKRNPGACLAIIAVLFATAAAAHAAQVVSSSTRGVAAVMQQNGFQIRPAGTAEATAGDLAPMQLFEIVRPNNQAFTIGRIFTSCTCIRLESDQRSFAAGQRAVLRLRNVIATPPAGQTYAIFIQITSPISTTLRYDTFVQSSQFVPAPEGYQPTRGNIVADGVLPDAAALSAATIDVIVPKSENYIPDTSAYTLRKQAEAKVAATHKTETETAEAPPVDPELQAAISSGVDVAEKNIDSLRGSGEVVAAGRRETRQLTVREVQDKARTEAQAATRLSSAPQAVRDEARRIGESLLGRETTRTAPAVPTAPGETAVDAVAATPLDSSGFLEETARLGRDYGTPALNYPASATSTKANASLSRNDAVSRAQTARTTIKPDETWAEVRRKPARNATQSVAATPAPAVPATPAATNPNRMVTAREALQSGITRAQGGVTSGIDSINVERRAGESLRNAAQNAIANTDSSGIQATEVFRSITGR